MDLKVLALAKKYTNDTAVQFGAVKGANCQISKIEDVDDKTEITFSWKNDSNVTKTSKAIIPHGAEGVSVTNVELNTSNHIIVTLSDGTEIDAGEISVSAKIGVDLRFTVDVGGVKAGSFFPKNTVTHDEMWQKIATKEEAPVITLTLTPNATVYDVVNDTIDSITLKATVTKKTYDIAKVDFYVGDTLVHSAASGITSGGTVSFVYTPDTPINSTTIFKVVATDIQNKKSAETTSNKITVSFVGNSYYGLIEPTIGEPTESDIKTLSKKLKIVKGFEYKNIICDYNKIVYAYPQSFGALTSIKDVPNNVNYTGSFTRTSVKVDGIDYYCYTLTEPTGTDGTDLTFA